MKTHNTIQAPIKKLRSSWVEIAYSKPKAGSVIKKSLSRNSTAIIKSRGTYITNSSNNNSNIY
jgi:hypothetical protein